jgi:hypothetical protein
MLACVSVSLWAADEPNVANETKPGMHADLTPDDVQRMESLLRDLLLAIVDGDTEGVERLVSPGYWHEMQDRLRGELRTHDYRILTLTKSLDAQSVTRLEQNRVKVLPQVRFQYVDGDGKVVEDDGQAYEFVLRREGDMWRLERSSLIDQFSGLSVGDVVGTVVLWVLTGLVALVFWGWMLFDASIRYRRLELMVAILLTPPLGAVIYFFLGFLRSGRRTPPRGEPMVLTGN